MHTLYKGLITPRGYGLFSSKNHVIELILIFSQCQYLFFYFEWNERNLLWIYEFATFHLMKVTSPGPYNAIFKTLLTPTVSQTKWPQQLDFLTDQLKWASVARSQFIWLFRIMWCQVPQHISILCVGFGGCWCWWSGIFRASTLRL